MPTHKSKTAKPDWRHFNYVTAGPVDDYLYSLLPAREAVLAGLGLSIGGSEWMFTPELKSGAVKVVLADWSLPPGELWAAFPTGRRASAKARAFTMFIERQLSEKAE